MESHSAIHKTCTDNDFMKKMSQVTTPNSVILTSVFHIFDYMNRFLNKFNLLFTWKCIVYSIVILTPSYNICITSFLAPSCLGFSFNYEAVLFNDFYHSKLTNVFVIVFV